jgi:DNA polymerase (family 10)
MTDRLLRVIENPNTSLMGHPTGRMLLRREGFSFDYDKVFAAAAKAMVEMPLDPPISKSLLASIPAAKA